MTCKPLFKVPQPRLPALRVPPTYMMFKILGVNMEVKDPLKRGTGVPGNLQ